MSMLFSYKNRCIYICRGLALCQLVTEAPYVAECQVCLTYVYSRRICYYSLGLIC